MSQETIQALADRLTNDPQLRAEFQRDPEAAAATAGIELDDSDRKALRSEDWAQVADEELSNRVSKRGINWSDGRLKTNVKKI